MKNLIILTIFFVCFFSNLIAQEQVVEIWRNVIDLNNSMISYTATNMAIDAIGNIYVTGFFEQETVNKLITLKSNPYGHIEWIKCYDDSDNMESRGLNIVAGISGSIYVTGYVFVKESNVDIVTIKYTQEGKEEWIKRYSSEGSSTDIPKSMVLDDLGNIYITGESFDLKGNLDFLTVKYNSSGHELWVKRYDSGLDDLPVKTKVTKSNLYIYGSSKNDNGFTYPVIAIYNFEGDLKSIIKYDSSANINYTARDFDIDSTYNLYILANYDHDSKIIKYSSDNKLIWIAEINDFGGYNENHIIYFSGYLYISRLESSPVHYGNTVIMQIDTSGLKKNWKSYWYYDKGVNPIFFIDDKAFFLAGIWDDNNYSEQRTGIVKFGIDSKFLWYQNIGNSKRCTIQPIMIKKDNYNNIIFTCSTSDVTGNHIIISKFSQNPDSNLMPINLLATNNELTWDIPEERLHYRVQIAKINNLVDLPIEDFITDTIVISNTLRIKKFDSNEYFWRVLSFNSEKASPFTETKSFLVSSESKITYLLQNFPNPFNKETKIKYHCSDKIFVSLTIFDILGKRIKTLVNEEKSPGSYEVMFDASSLSSGIYFYKLQSGNFTETKKLVLMK